jgi:hypothetical protein
MRTGHWLWSVVGIVCLFAALGMSTATNDATYFLFGWPLALVLVGVGDHERTRGRTASHIGLAFLLMALVILWRAR